MCCMYIPWCMYTLWRIFWECSLDYISSYEMVADYHPVHLWTVNTLIMLMFMYLFCLTWMCYDDRTHLG